MGFSVPINHIMKRIHQFPALRLTVFLLLGFLCFGPGFIQAQTLTLTGKVTDKESGEGIPYAMVEIQGRSIGVTTNSEGAFTLKQALEIVKDAG